MKSVAVPLLASKRLADLGDDSIPVILDLLADERPAVRRGAAFAAGKAGVGTTRVKPSLRDRLPASAGGRRERLDHLLRGEER